MSRSTRLFVYGSLMTDLKYSSLLAEAVFQGLASTRDPYELFDLGPYPAASPGGIIALQGEVYEVGAETLARVDTLEGHPELYRRSLRPLSDGSSAWIYEIVLSDATRQRLEASPRVEAGDWRSWLLKRSAT